jgi:hypothetical protein
MTMYIFAWLRSALAKRQSDHRNRLFPNTTFIIHYNLYCSQVPRVHQNLSDQSHQPIRRPFVPARSIDIGTVRDERFDLLDATLHVFLSPSCLRTCKQIIFHFWLAAASAGGVSKTRTTNQ